MLGTYGIPFFILLKMMELSDEALADLYQWVDQIPLSRAKKNITRDFSDGVQVAEIVKHFFPKLVDLYNYPSRSNFKQKKDNWDLLNRRVFKKLRFELSDDVIRGIAGNEPGMVVKVLDKLRTKIDHALWYKKNYPQRESDQPEADQVHDFSQRKVTHRHKSPTRGSEPIVPQVTNVAAPRLAVPYFSGQETDAVSSLMYEEKIQESKSKDETIEILQAKISRLEHLMHLKDLKINDLQEHLNDLQPTVQTRKQPKNNQQKYFR